jgi:tetratricopeptide (TPR) repeat protein
MRPTDVSTLARALGRLDLSLAALEPAEAPGIVRLENRRFRFGHPLLRSAAYHAAAAPDRRAVHRALADAFDARADLGRCAWHRAAATITPDESVAEELEVAALDARARGAPAEAGSALEAAARLTPAPGDRSRRLVAAAHDLHIAGKAERANALIDAALLESPDDALLRADIEQARAQLQMLNGSPVAIRNRLLGEAERVRPVDKTRATAMALDATFLAAAAGEPAEMLRLAEELLPVAQEERELGELAEYYRAAALVLCGRCQEAIPTLERVERALEEGVPFANPYVSIALPIDYLWIDSKVQRGRSLLSGTVDRARREGVLVALPYSLGCLAEADFRLGNWPSAYAAAAESVALAEDTGQTGNLAYSLVRLAQVEAGLGREEECRAHAERALDMGGGSKLEESSFS